MTPVTAAARTLCLLFILMFLVGGLSGQQFERHLLLPLIDTSESEQPAQHTWGPIKPYGHGDWGFDDRGDDRCRWEAFGFFVCQVET